MSVLRLGDRRTALVVHDGAATRLWVLDASSAPELPIAGNPLESLAPATSSVRIFEDAQRRLVIFATADQPASPRWLERRYGS